MLRLSVISKRIFFINHEGFAVLKDNSTVEVLKRRKEEVMKLLRLKEYFRLKILDY